MLSLVRPGKRPDFEGEAEKLLGEVRLCVANRGGLPHSDDFKGRELWSGSWKKDGRHKRALAGGAAVVSAKCAWCERIRDVSRELDVEHYRPKTAVTRWKGTPPLVSDVPPPEEDVPGQGYWWLAFSWGNYTLACKDCNQAWKRNLFPVVEPRPACVEGVEKSEQPLLVDPATPFKTGEHFAWAVDAHMEGVSDQGRATIVTCGLNRKGLVAARLKLVPQVNELLHEVELSYRRGDLTCCRRALGQLGLLGGREAEFAGMVRWMTEQALGAWENLPGLPT